MPVTTDFAEIRDDPEIAVVAEVMGGLEPAGDYVLDLLRAGKPVVTANKQLVARRGAELFAGRRRRRRAAPLRGLGLRGDPGDQGAARGARRLERPPRARDRQRDDELRPHRDGARGDLRGCARRGAAARIRGGRPDRGRLRPGRSREDGDPRHRRLRLARRARGRRLRRARAGHRGGRRRRPADGHGRPPRRRCDASSKGRSTSASGRRWSTASHPLAAVEGAFNAVMLQGDAIREITLEGPGAGGLETASAVVADMVTIVGTTGTGFLQNDACWRELPRLPEGEIGLPVLRARRGRRPAGRARPGRAPARRAGNLGRAARPGAVRAGRDPARRHARGSGGAPARRTRRDRRARGDPWRGVGAAGRSPTAGSRGWDGADARRGRYAAPRTRRGSPSGSGCELWLKWEGANPTGSFKDRGMAVAVARALERGAPGVVCASTGNTAASAAAYAARAGLPAVDPAPERSRRARKARPGARRRRGAARGRGLVRRTCIARRAGSPTRRAG